MGIKLIETCEQKDGSLYIEIEWEGKICQIFSDGDDLVIHGELAFHVAEDYALNKIVLRRGLESSEEVDK